MSTNPEALLFIATGCQHCPMVLQSLSELIKAGDIGELHIVNIQQNPERARELNIRSVPWVKIGPFELTGLRTKSELTSWVQKVNDPAAMGEYFGELMTSGELDKVQQMVEQHPEWFKVLIQLMANTETTLSVRLGVSAIIEDLAGQDILKNNIDALGEHTHHNEARIRNDACYFLGLSHSRDAETYIRPLLEDKDAEVRETAIEALEELA